MLLFKFGLKGPIKCFSFILRAETPVKGLNEHYFYLMILFSLGSHITDELCALFPFSIRVKSGKFGYQVNLYTYLQTV